MVEVQGQWISLWGVYGEQSPDTSFDGLKVSNPPCHQDTDDWSGVRK